MNKFPVGPKTMEKIEGIPDGWRLVRIGTPLHKEWFLDSDTKPTLANFDFSKCCLAIVERIKPPEPTYRPFANAAEFEPHRDKWICIPRKSVNKIKAIAYDDQGIFSFKRFWGYSPMFDCGAVFKDGTRFGVNELPFGIKVSGRVW